jgi:hypothetical protein
VWEDEEKDVFLCYAQLLVHLAGGLFKVGLYLVLVSLGPTQWNCIHVVMKGNKMLKDMKKLWNTE